MSGLSFRVNSLSVSFGGRQVLDIGALEIKKHAITVITGASGCGKSTFLRSLNRLNECFNGVLTSGEIYINIAGIMENIMSLPAEALRRRAAMVFQHPNVLPVSIERNFTIPLVHGAGLKKQEAQHLMQAQLKAAGLWDEVKDRLGMPALNLSGGQQQRLCIARALSLSPDVLLLDEPTSSLDKKAGEVIEGYISRLAQELTVVMVTHNPAQAEKLGDDFINMETVNRVSYA